MDKSRVSYVTAAEQLLIGYPTQAQRDPRRPDGTRRAGSGSDRYLEIMLGFGSGSHCLEVASSAVHQADLCVTSALCYSLAPCAVSQLHAMCPGLELVIKTLELGDVCDDMGGCPAVDHQAPHVDTLAAWLGSCRPIGHQEHVFISHFLGGPPSCVLVASPSAGCVAVCVAFAVAAPQFALASAGHMSSQAAPIAHHIRCSPFSSTFSWGCTGGSCSPLSSPHRHHIVLSGWGTHLFNVLVASKLCFEFGKQRTVARHKVAEVEQRRGGQVTSSLSQAEDVVVIYNRVPKTASTSFTNIAYDLCGKNRFHVLHINTSKNNPVLSLQDQARPLVFLLSRA
ncbi:Heparan sulfate 2-O-sulfotransferase 1 [Merluccius polli]|uniref:Heparan sulfate 2-O-sulfotransferase 1 n=1 Tax=Merluccius polli TaxID=89951 RepID=A0AA47ME82_MERPO|nr:Heparan sulfate 2-O-sulfotransferase 1 [Merluccius polli]